MRNIHAVYSSTFERLKFSPNANEDAYEGVYYILSKNQKDIKPLLLLHVAELFGGKIEDCLPAAYAMELFNNSGIVLEDVVCQYAPFNRRPSNYEQLSLSGSIITGDQLIILSYKYISMINSDHLREVVQMFNNSVVNFVKGQQLSLGLQNPDTISFSDYIHIISLQSADLMSLSFRIGALLGGADYSDIKIMSEAGKNLGLSIQLQNEWDKVYLKNEMSQIENPFIFYKTLELASDSQKQILLQGFENDNGQSSELQDIFKYLDVKQKTSDSINHYYQEALTGLENLSIEKQKITKLVETINSLNSEVYQII
jgi:geranylgeranyl diphosphate synthase type II